MPRYARTGAPRKSSGFTLLEVVLATAILASAAVAVSAIYFRALRNASDARDLAIATSVARNALEEGIAGAAKPAENAEIPARRTLEVSYAETPAGEELLTDTMTSTVSSAGSGQKVTGYTAKRALYIQPAEEEKGAGEGEESATEATEAPYRGPVQPGGANANE